MEPDWEVEDDCCPNCGGEGVIFDCFDGFCEEAEFGCENCAYPCDWCQNRSGS